MDQKLTPDKLNGLPKEALILLIMSMQDQLTALNSRLDDLTEQIRVANNQRFGRSTEKLEQFSGQGFFDPDGNLYFNETEAILDRCILRRRTDTGAFAGGHSAALADIDFFCLSGYFSFNNDIVVLRYPFKHGVG